MKKSVSIISGLSALIMSCAVAISFASKGMSKADAGAQNITIVNDNFNQPEYANDYNPSKWLHRGDKTIRQSEESESYLYNNGTTAICGEAMFFGTKVVVQELEYFQFDIKFYNTKWIGIKFNKSAIASGQVATMAYEGPIMYYGNHPDVMSGWGTINTKPATYSGSNYTWAVGTETLVDQWVTFRFVPIDETHIKGYIFRQGGTPDETLAVVYSMTSKAEARYDYANCQVGFQPEGGCKFALDNIKIKGANVDINEDFSRQYEDQDDNPLGYVKATPTSTAQYEYAGNSNLCFYSGSKLGDQLLAKKEVKLDESVSETVTVISAQLNLRFPEDGSEDEKFAYMFGLPTADSELYSCGGLLVFNKNSVVLKIFENGSQTSYDYENTISTDFTVETGVNVIFTLQKNGVVTLSLNGGTLHNFEGVTKYAGYTGLIAYSNISHVIVVDDVVIKNSTYFVPVTKSVTHNFSNNFFGNPGFEDFYLPYSYAGTIEAVDGKLKYTGCADDAFFGSAYQYDSFILDYKLCSIYVDTAYITGDFDNMDTSDRSHMQMGRWIGLDVSRKIKTYNYYGSYGMFHFQVCPDPRNDVEYLQVYVNEDSVLDRADLETSGNFRRDPIPCSLFRNIQYDDVTKMKSEIREEDYVCIRWVSDGTNLELYLKTNGENEFTKYATIKNLELNGYFALANTGFTYLEYDDFSMANTSPLYICADNEAPETVTETETITIYDGSNVDVDWNTELQLNNSGNLFMILTIVLGVTTVGLAAGLLVVILLKKKKKE